MIEKFITAIEAKELSDRAEKHKVIKGKTLVERIIILIEENAREGLTTLSYGGERLLKEDEIKIFTDAGYKVWQKLCPSIVSINISWE